MNPTLFIIDEQAIQAVRLRQNLVKGTLFDHFFEATVRQPISQTAAAMVSVSRPTIIRGLGRCRVTRPHVDGHLRLVGCLSMWLWTFILLLLSDVLNGKATMFNRRLCQRLNQTIVGRQKCCRFCTG